DSLSSIDPRTTKPTAKVGPRASLAVGADGTAYAVSSTRKRLVTIRAGSTSPDTSELDSMSGTQAPQLTVVGGRLVLLDPVSGTVTVPSTGATVQLPSRRTGEPALVLQQPGPGADHVLVADGRAAYSVPLDGGKAVVLARAGGGTPARPVRVAGC